MAQDLVGAGDVLAELCALVGLPAAALAMVDLPGHDPVLPSSFRVGTAAQACIAAVACAANTIWHLRTGHLQHIRVEMRHAAAEFRSEQYLRVGGGPAPELWDAIAGAYRCKDGRWIRIHTNFPHHRDGILHLLGCAYNREAVRRAVIGWEADGLETAVAEAGLVAAMLRSFEEWDAHPQGRAVARLPLLTISRIGDAPTSPLPPPSPAPGVDVAARPLSSLRVLDLTRVIAGPVCGRVLAAHGAEVLAIGAAHLPSIEPLVIDTGRGKRSAFVDLRTADGREALTRLLRAADIFVQSYRPGALAARGFGPKEAAALRPGIIYVSLSAYGHAGPWVGRRGFDSIVQTACGLNYAEASAAGTDGPKPLPCQALDHASGYLMALGALAALRRRSTEGGSWLVQVSLAQTAHWLRGLGRVDDGFACSNPALADGSGFLEETPSSWGRLLAVRHAAQMSETPPRWTAPSVPLGTHPPRWETQ